jgi:acyl-CoA thioesterase
MATDDGTRSGQRLAEAVSAGMFALDRVSRGLGIEIVEIRPRLARMRMTVRDDMLNAHGICHGGVIFTLADSAFAYACNSENASSLATHCAIDFIDAARLGEVLVAVARETVRQSRLGVHDVTVTAGDGRTIAVFRGNSYRVGGETIPGAGSGSPE